MPETLLPFLLASALLSLAPGPDNIFVLMQSALYGRRAGLVITLGLCSGLLIHTLAVALGVASLFLVSTLAFTVLKFAGAAYLLYLAWQAFRATAVSLDDTGTSTTPTLGALYRRGIIMNLGNPKVAIFFLAFLPQFADPAEGAMPLQLTSLGLFFILVAWVIFSLVALLSGVIADVLRHSPRAQTILQRIAGLIFVLLALRLAASTR